MRTKILVIAAMGCILGGTARAQFSASLQTNTISAVTSNWVGNGTYVVGSNTFRDALIIQSGGVLSNGTGYVGYEANASNNIAIVRDSGSAWSNRFDLYVGFHGAGNRLVISNGATVVDSNATIGTVNFLSNSNNSVLVTDPGSVWTNSGNLDIGRLCSGNQLVISNGGKVIDFAAGVGDHSGASTNGAVIGNRIVVTGTNSAWINTLNISEIPFDDNAGGQLLTVANGAAFFSGAGVGIADSAASDHIIILVTDPGTTWTNSAQLSVGGFGSYSQFVVSNGATAYSGLSVIGGNSVSNGVVVTSPGSMWTVGTLTMGSVGTASFLVVTNGGLVVAQTETIATGSGSGSLILAGGTNLVYQNLQAGALGGAGTVSLLGGALFVTNATTTASVQVNTNSTLIIGPGTFKADNLVVTNGGAVQYNLSYQVNDGTVTVVGGNVQAGSNLVIATTATSTGTIVVAGGSLIATNGPLGIGNDGTITGTGGSGRLTISNGTLVATTILLGSTSGGKSDLVLADGGQIICGPGSNCLFIVDSLGFQQIADLDWVGSTLEIAVTAPGDYSVSGGATATFDDLYVGYGDVGTMTMASGVANVDSRLIVGHLGSPLATGAVWINGGTLTVLNNYTIIGNSGVGQMTVSNGTVIETSIFVGNSGNPGSLTVAGGTMTALSGITVGDCGSGFNGFMTSTGGNLFVTNAAHNAVLDVRDGLFTVSGGFVQVDTLVVTSACADVTHTGGTLLYNSLVLDPNSSAVGDGIPNGWKQHYGLDPFDPNLGSKSFSGNGRTVLQAYQSGFAPNNAAAYPHVISAAKSGNDIKVTYLGANGDSTYSPGVSSRTNVLEFTAGTANGSYSNNFTNAGQTNILSGGTGVGLVTNMIDSGGAANASRYYRIRVLTP